MKKLIIWLVAIATWQSAATAQAKKNSGSKTAAKKSSVKKAAQKPATNTVSLTSTSSFNAKAPASSSGLVISDPVVSSLNQRANGSTVRISPSGVVGMPKRAYGFANGRILLRSTSATTSGTSTGMGSVGTGNSLSTIGSNGAFIGMNGKSPHAGSAMWGNASGLVNPYSNKKE